MAKSRWRHSTWWLWPSTKLNFKQTINNAIINNNFHAKQNAPIQIAHTLSLIWMYGQQRIDGGERRSCWSILNSPFEYIFWPVYQWELAMKWTRLVLVICARWWRPLLTISRRGRLVFGWGGGCGQSFRQYCRLLIIIIFDKALQHCHIASRYKFIIKLYMNTLS